MHIIPTVHYNGETYLTSFHLRERFYLRRTSIEGYINTFPQLIVGVQFELIMYGFSFAYEALLFDMLTNSLELFGLIRSKPSCTPKPIHQYDNIIQFLKIQFLLNLQT